MGRAVGTKERRGLMSGLALLLGAAGGMTASALGAGVATHFEVADRVASRIDAAGYPGLAAVVATLDQQIIRTGSYFPDWGFAAEILFQDSSFNRLGEDAHWPRWYEPAFDYYAETYGTDFDTEHERRVFAFLLGSTCHSEADEVWHFGSTGFLNQGINRDLPHLPRSAADASVEVLTDLFVQADHRPGEEDLRWFLPIADIQNIYRRYDGTEVEAEWLIGGTTLQILITWIEDRLGHLVCRTASGELPWTYQHYETWYDGGVNHMASSTAGLWQRLWDRMGAGSEFPAGLTHGAPAALPLGWAATDAGVLLGGGSTAETGIGGITLEDLETLLGLIGFLDLSGILDEVLAFIPADFLAVFELIMPGFEEKLPDVLERGLPIAAPLLLEGFAQLTPSEPDEHGAVWFESLDVEVTPELIGLAQELTGVHEPCCPGNLDDHAGTGLGFFDVVEFLTLFAGGDDRADLAAPIGELGFGDLIEYLNRIAEGC